MKHRSLHPIILTALLLSLFGGSLIFTPAHAASIVVNTNADTVADDGFCSLREAIANANNDSTLYATAGECNSGSGADVITFAASLSGSTITLGSNLNINEDLTITGPGASSLILDGNHTTQIFIINNLETVTISGMTIMNGNSIYNDGGAIYNYGYLTVQNVTFKDNSATASDYSSGGAIFCDGSIGATLTVSISVFDGNQATWRGGAIDGCAALTITDSEFTNNTVTGPSIDTDPNHPAGGAISNSYTLNITGSQFNNNTVTKGISSISWGGAIYNAGTASISNSTLFGNSADLGGGMYNSDSSPTLTNVTLSNNSANYGGGMYNRDGSPTLTNVTFSGNSASTSGGGMFNNDSSPTLSQTVIANSTGGDCVITRGTVTAFFTLIEDTGANACGLTTGVNGNIIGSDPILGPLANNGGFTQTHALLAGS
ncbi:MAG TPA: hypothetical protein DCX53_05015, partial [Anaerolineae bacterium]|nr:hypothetical protein [Anaerolineae bacterium]